MELRFDCKLLKTSRSFDAEKGKTRLHRRWLRVFLCYLNFTWLTSVSNERNITSTLSSFLLFCVLLRSKQTVWLRINSSVHDFFLKINYEPCFCYQIYIWHTDKYCYETIINKFCIETRLKGRYLSISYLTIKIAIASSSITVAGLHRFIWESRVCFSSLCEQKLSSFRWNSAIHFACIHVNGKSFVILIFISWVWTLKVPNACLIQVFSFAEVIIKI